MLRTSPDVQHETAAERAEEEFALLCPLFQLLKKNLQLVLHTRVITGETALPQVVASHVW